MMLSVAWLVAIKDLRIEWRSKILIWQVLPFSVIALVLAGLAVGPSAVQMRRVAPGIFYLVTLLVSLLMIQRSQAVEAPVGTRTSVQMLGLDPAGVFLGKTLALFVELVVSSVILLSGVILVMHAPLVATLSASPSILLALGAIAAGGAIYGALIGDSASHATLLPIIALPPFAGILIAGEKSLSGAISGGGLSRWLVFLILALCAYLAVGVLLYGVAQETP
jgi:heme exporter protein B